VEVDDGRPFADDRLGASKRGNPSVGFGEVRLTIVAVSGGGKQRCEAIEKRTD